MKVLVYGGTGSQGSAVVQKLTENGHQPYILTRKPDNIAQAVAGDLADPASLEAASRGMDAVSLHVPFFVPDPALAVTYARNAIDAAKAAGVRHIVFNTSGPVIPHRLGVAGYDMRHDVIDYLKASGVPHIIIQPTGYLENLLGPWTAQGIIERDVLTYPVAADERIGWLATADLGALMTAALERPELAPAHFVVSGVENLTGPELAARMSAGLGRTITYEAITPEAFGELLDAAFGAGMGAQAAAGYAFQRDNAHLFTMWTDMQPVLAKLPVRMTSVEEWAKQFAPAFTRQPQQA